MSQQTDEPATLTFPRYEALKAIPRGEIHMSVAEPGIWRRGEGRFATNVTGSVRWLLEQKLAVADPTFVDGRRGAKVTQAGYAALSKANRHRPSKKR